MSSLDLIRTQTLIFRGKVSEILQSFTPEEQTRIPAGWNNNALWHAGHLLITPRLLALGLSGRPLGAPSGWRGVFAKDSSPKNWPDQISIPTYAELCQAIVPTLEEIFDTVGDSAEKPFENPYVTSTGVILNSPLEALQFSFCHDGIHLGLILALRRALRG